VADDRVVYLQTTALELSFDRQIAINVDGQVFQASRCRYGLEPKAARVLAPHPTR
jgi:hypothetical protein